MALEEYKRKRDFKQTPEPPAKLGKGKQRRFVVQKHRATRLHYDFRLEMDGVLKSWAVPKGPSLDPADKRLAMQVEDHPVSYFDFEGTIPAGNYGAGTVMVWDVGTWEPLGDPAEMLRKGDLKFRLNGEKLKGEFALIHIKARRPGQQGHGVAADQASRRLRGEGYDIDKYDYSVLTKRTMQQIAGDEGSAEWESSRKATAHGTSSEKRLAGRLDCQGRRQAGVRRKEGQQEGHPGAGPQSAPAKAQSDGCNKALMPARHQAVKKKPQRKTARFADSCGELGRKLPCRSAMRPMLATLVDEPFDERPTGSTKSSGTAIARSRFSTANRAPGLAQPERPHRRLSRTAQTSPTTSKLSTRFSTERLSRSMSRAASFSLMQQRTGVGGRRPQHPPDARRHPVVYYVFDLLYLDGYDLTHSELEERKALAGSI